MASQLSPYRLGKAREVYNFFNILNSVSWNLLVGVIITLYVLRLRASSTYIGLLGASFYISLFFLPLGKILARRFSIIGVFSFAWTFRSIGMILAVAAPFFEYAGYRKAALLLVIIGIFIFQFFRGIGMIGNNPVLSELAAGPDRDSYMTQIQIINSAIGMFGSFLIAMVLGTEPPVFIFSILFALGVISGIISGYIIKKVPEPPREQDSRNMNLIQIFKEAFAQDALRNFIFILFLVVLVSGVTRTFVVVYAREVFGHNDGLISMYSVFGGLGYLIAGLSVKFLIDRTGAKPLFLVCVITGLSCLIPTIFFPASAVENITWSILFMAFLFFMLNFGFLGSEGLAQTYFLVLIPTEKILDMGILYFFIFGVAGAGGSFLSGLLIDLLLVIGISHYVAFKILFIIMIALSAAALVMQKKMKPLGSLPLQDAFGVIFSFRDLRAISLLDKLNKTQDSQQEELLLSALHDTPSRLAIDGLLERARSPRLAVRLESIRALEKLHHLSEKAEKALIYDISNNQYTTAYISARILGKHKCTEAIPMLRESAASNDYMLAGEAMIALAKMKDEEFRPQIEKNILASDNPRLKIMGAEALGIYLCSDSLFVLMEILSKADKHLFLMEEVVLAIAAILGTQRIFYPVLVKYIADNSLAVTLGIDEAEAACEHCKAVLGARKKRKDAFLLKTTSNIELFQTASKEYMEMEKGAYLSRWILELPDEAFKGKSTVKAILSEAVLDNELCALICLRILIVQWAANELCVWTEKSTG
jgi:MFS family permease